MRKFTNGKLVSFVEDNDGRIPAYLKNGWKEESLTPKPTTKADERREQAVKAAGGKKATTPDKKVNEAIKAAETAATDGEATDDGLLKKDGKDK